MSVMNYFMFLRHVALSVLITSLMACGGGGNENSPSDVPVIPEPDSGDPPAPPSGELIIPIVNVVMNDQQLELSWSESFASLYRVLYWEGDEVPQGAPQLAPQLAPQTATTNNLAYVTATLNTGTYTVIVEAYDELGNSLFSAPTSVEVQ